MVVANVVPNSLADVLVGTTAETPLQMVGGLALRAECVAIAFHST